MCLARDDLIKITTAIEKWKYWRPSQLLFHSEDCCLIAHKWFVAMDRSFEGDVLGGPYWIRQMWNWGPSKWPLYWCQVEKLDTLDCGILAALAREAFKTRGLTAFPVQLIQRFSLQDVQQWQRKWESDLNPPNWLLDNLAYHEACAVIFRDNHIKIWDPTDSRWISPEAQGYGAAVAISVTVEGFEYKTLVWESLDIQPNIWTMTIAVGGNGSQ